MNTPMSLTITVGVPTFTDQDGRTYTAPDAKVEPGDSISVEVSQGGRYLKVERAEAVTRYPLRDQGGFHMEDLRAIPLVSNPFLPPAGSNP